jgi:hypothetical protein
MKCQQLIGPPNAPRRCTVPATYTLEAADRTDRIDPEAYVQHFCVIHARKAAATMDRTFWQVTRDADGLAL